MVILTAKKYSTNSIPLLGEYALYKNGDICYFAIGDGETPIERLITKKSYPVFVIPEKVFNSMKRLGEKYPPNKGHYKWEDLDEHDLQDVHIVADFQYCRGTAGNTDILTEWDINPPSGITDEGM